MSEKNFVKGLNLKKFTFDNGGFVINAGIKIDDFIEWLYENNPDSKEWINIDIKESKDGTKMYAELNTYKKES